MKLVGITALVFDFDGTLATCPYDFAHMRREVLRTVLEHGLDPQALGQLGLLETIDAGAELLGEDQVRAQAFRQEAMRRLSAVEFEAAARTVLLPGIVAAVERLRLAGYHIGIVTRNSAVAVAQIIGDNPLHFDALLCREDVRRPKPHPEHVQQMLHLLAGTPALSLMIGDHPMDIEMGHAAGMGTVAVLTGQSSEADLRAAHPDLLLPSVLVLTEMLLGAPGEIH